MQFSRPPRPDENEVTSRRMTRCHRHAGECSDDVPYLAKTICMSTVHTSPVRWLWDDIIPVGKVTTLTGDTSIGKSFLATDIIADVTRFQPKETKRNQEKAGQVVLVSPDPDLQDVINPRLSAAGVDLNKVNAIQGVRNRELKPNDAACWPFQLNKDLRLLELEIGRHRIAELQLDLVVIDPFPLQHFSGRHAVIELTATLNHLAEIAAWSQVAILLVVNTPPHLQKSILVRTLETAVHSTWTVVKDFDDPKRRLLLPVKTNLSEDEPGRAFRIQNGRLVWEPDPVPLTAEQYRAESREPAQTSLSNQQLSELARVREWLRERLAAGPVPSQTIKAEASTNEISERTLRRAFCDLNGIAQRGKDTLAWEWTLPDQGIKCSEEPMRNGHPTTTPDEQGTVETKSESESSEGSSWRCL